MFSRSNYPLNYLLKAMEWEEHSPSSGPELLIHHLADSREHHELSRGAERGEKRRCRHNTEGFSADSFVFFNGKFVLCHISIDFRCDNVSFMLQIKYKSCNFGDSPKLGSTFLVVQFCCNSFYFMSQQIRFWTVGSIQQAFSRHQLRLQEVVISIFSFISSILQTKRLID